MYIHMYGTCIHAHAFAYTCTWVYTPLHTFINTHACLRLHTYIHTHIHKYIHTYKQDQDRLLVKRRNDNHSPGPVIRELVPSYHQRSNTILCIFSRWDQRIGESIPIRDRLEEGATFINICISNWSLKSHTYIHTHTLLHEYSCFCIDS